MRILRATGAALLWVLASVLLLLAVVLAATIILLPVGILLGHLSIRMYRLGLKWVLPRASDVRKGLRVGIRRQRRNLRRIRRRMR